MKLYVMLLSVFLSFPVSSSENRFLSGNVPEDILHEMTKRNCAPIPDFYAIGRSEGGYRIGSPYADGYTHLDAKGKEVTIFGCKLLTAVKGGGL